MKLMGIKNLVAGLLFVAPVAVVQAQTTLQMNNWLPPSHFVVTEVFKPWADDIAKATEGRVRINIITSSLGPPARQFDLARQGVADITWSTQGYTPGRFLSSEGVELPFLSDSAEALSVAYWRTHKAHFEKLNEYAGVKLLSLHVQPPGELFTIKKPVNNLDDIKNMKIRIVGPMTSDLVEQAGGVAVAAPVSQLFELVSSGVVDGTFLTTDSIPQLKLKGQLNHRTTVDGGFYNTSFFLVMNPKAWEKLSPADQQAIEKLSGEAFARRVGKLWDEKRVYGIQQFQDSKGQHIHIQGAAFDNLKAKLSGVREKWVAAMKERGVDGDAALKMVQEEVKNYSSAR